MIMNLPSCRVVKAVADFPAEVVVQEEKPAPVILGKLFARERIHHREHALDDERADDKPRDESQK
jgi:hypothetical protein